MESAYKYHEYVTGGWTDSDLVDDLADVALIQMFARVQVPTVEAVIPAPRVQVASIWTARQGVDDAITALREEKETIIQFHTDSTDNVRGFCR